MIWVCHFLWCWPYMQYYELNINLETILALSLPSFLSLCSLQCLIWYFIMYCIGIDYENAIGNRWMVEWIQMKICRQLSFDNAARKMDWHWGSYAMAKLCKYLKWIWNHAYGMHWNRASKYIHALSYDNRIVLHFITHCILCSAIELP